MLIHTLKNDVHKLEYDAETQWRFHRKMSWFWLFNIIVVVVVFIINKAFWEHVSILYLVIVSLYANFATDYGAVPSSYAAMKAQEMSDNKESVTLEPSFANPGFSPLDKDLVSAVLTKKTDDKPSRPTFEV